MTGGHVWAPTCHPHSECHKALLFQGSGCTQLVLMVSPKAHRLTLSPKLYVCKESFIGTPLLPHTALRHAHSFNQVGTATAAPSLPNVGVSPDPYTSSPVPGILACGCWTVPVGVWLCCPAFPAVPLGTPRSLSFQQSTGVLSGEMPGAQLQFPPSWSIHTGQQYNINTGCSVSWGCAL